MEDRIVIFDTTLRDGEQSPGCSMNVKEKIKIAKQLERLKVDVIEAGFPIASEGEVEAVKEIAKQVEGCSVAALARTKKIDIDRAWEALQHAKKPRIHTFIATSDIHLKYKLKKSRAEVLKDAVGAVQYAKSLTDDVEFSAEDAARSDIDYLCQVLEAVIEAGATVVNIPDTVGYSIPSEFGNLIGTIMKKVSNINGVIVSVHCHNDLGLAVANSVAAVQNGARQVECTVNGIGERAGNASLEEFVMALHTRRDLLNLTTNVKTDEIFKTSRLLSSITGIFVQPNKAIVGKNAFAHEAGIHQDGIIKEPLTYEIMTPESVGIKERALIVGKHSGRHALRKRYETMGYQLSKEELERAYLLFKNLADKKKTVFDEDLIALLRDESSEVPETFSLEYIQTISGPVPTATVKLTQKGESIIDSATGDGPVDAAYKAIDRITKIPGTLLDYSISSVSRGKDAIGEVFVRVVFGGGFVVGKAASTDVIEASVKAYLNALNKAIYTREPKIKRK